MATAMPLLAAMVVTVRVVVVRVAQAATAQVVMVRVATAPPELREAPAAMRGAQEARRTTEGLATAVSMPVSTTQRTSQTTAAASATATTRTLRRLAQPV
jgi:hypothetical protein